MLNLCFICENSTDIRLVEGLAGKFKLTILGRNFSDRHIVNHPSRMPVEIILGPNSRLKFVFFIWKYLRQHREQFDYVIVQGYGLSALAANLTSYFTNTSTAMLVCSPTEAYYRCRKSNPTPSKVFRLHELLGLQTIARINASIGRQYFVLSQYLFDTIRSHGTRKPISIIPVYGVNTNIFVKPSESKLEIRRRRGLPTTGSLIFFSSRIAPEKDSETLLLAFQQLLQEGRDLWLLHRSGGYKTFIEEAKRYKVAERVIATDAVHPERQLPLDYQACDLCVQSSREEGLGFSPLEALACGIPVVASAVGGLNETIVDGQTGWTYPVGDCNTLAMCIRDALDNPVKAAQYASAGRDLVCTKYDRQVVFEKLYKDCSVNLL